LSERLGDVKKIVKNVELEEVNFQMLLRSTVPKVKLNKENDMRTLTALEFLSTEQTYVTGLHVLVKNYLEPMSYYALTHQKLKHEVVEQIFSNISDIFLLHHELCTNIENRLEKMVRWRRLFG